MYNQNWIGREVLDSAQIRALLAYFGIDIPYTQRDEFFRAVWAINPRNKTTADGKPIYVLRQDLDEDDSKWTEEQRNLIMEAAYFLRMVERPGEAPIQTPLIGSFDLTTIMGAFAKANLDRAEFVMEAYNKGKAWSAFTVIAGSTRKLNDAAEAEAAFFAPNAETEFNLCEEAAATILRANPSMVPFKPWRIDDEKAGNPQVIESVLSGMIGTPFLCSSSRIAAVTTQIYEVPTYFDLKKIAKQFGITQIHVAGNPSDPEKTKNRRLVIYLSEIIRAIKAALSDIE